MLLEAWRQFEVEAGSGAQAVAAVEKKLPRRVKKRRQLHSADGAPAGQEEYFDYIFPVRPGCVRSVDRALLLDRSRKCAVWEMLTFFVVVPHATQDEEGAAPSLKILQAAYAWKAKMALQQQGAATEGAGGGDGGGGDGGGGGEEDETRAYREGGSDDEDKE